MVKRMALLTQEKCPECGSQLWLESISSNPVGAVAKFLCDNCQTVYEKENGEFKLLYKLKRKKAIRKLFFGI